MHMHGQRHVVLFVNYFKALGLGFTKFQSMVFLYVTESKKKSKKNMKKQNQIFHNIKLKKGIISNLMYYDTHMSHLV